MIQPHFLSSLKLVPSLSNLQFSDFLSLSIALVLLGILTYMNRQKGIEID